MISRIVKMQFRTSEIDNFKSLFEIFFTLSIWEHPQALENYRNSELFKDTWSKTKALFDEQRPEAWSTVVVNQA